MRRVPEDVRTSRVTPDRSLMDMVRVVCGWCRRLTPRTVPRLEGPRLYEHVRRGGERHRMVVAPDPDGTDHWVWRVADDELAEDVVRRVLAEPAVHERAVVLAEARLRLLRAMRTGVRDTGQTPGSS
ncbi:hypothetical protein [Candidatus Palauibacter sp.]|uniref:hypothetical protein n=1 Tax=Candidatus Palauibacter sp. TaxID=3101350 RepID=UPI003CC662CD